jgi:hypothetical protein
MPVSSRWLPLSTVHAQPPLPEGTKFRNAAEEEVNGKKIDPYDISPENEHALMAGTDRWCLFPVTSYSPRVRGCWVNIHEPEKNAEGEAAKYWPQNVRPWSVGAWMEDTEMGILEPSQWKL